MIYIVLSIVFESLAFSVFSLGPVCMLASGIMIHTRHPPGRFEWCTYFCNLYKPVGYTLMDESRFMPESYLAFHRKGAGRLCKTSTSTSKTVSAKLSRLGGSLVCRDKLSPTETRKSVTRDWGGLVRTWFSEKSESEQRGHLVIGKSRLHVLGAVLVNSSFI